MKAQNILETIGNNTYVKINNLFDKDYEVWVKQERVNPGGKHKGPNNASMVEDAEKKGLLNPGSVIIEPTSGNTGIGLAIVAAVKKYKLILVMPELMTIERRRLMAIYGASFELTPREKGMKGAIEKATELVKSTPNAWMPQQFDNEQTLKLKRLIGLDGTREAEMDRLLRAERFIDLLAVTRHAVRVSVESYSLKALEESFGFVRGVELRAASAALRRLAAALELSGRGDVSAEDRAAVEAYNRDDCLSTAALRDWLEERRAELEARRGPVERPAEKSGDASEAVEEKAADVKAVALRLTSGLPEDRESWGPAEKARWLLAHQLEYFRREDKSAWWEFFRIQDLDHEDLLEERKAISGLRYVDDGENAGRAAGMPLRTVAAGMPRVHCRGPPLQLPGAGDRHRRGRRPVRDRRRAKADRKGEVPRPGRSCAGNRKRARRPGKSILRR